MESPNLTRKQLYDLLWSEPVTSIAKRFGISDASLRAICKEHQIPLPKNGHWMKQTLQIVGNFATQGRPCFYKYENYQKLSV